MKRLIPQRFVKVRAFLDRHGALIAFFIVVIGAALGIWQTRQIADTQNQEQKERIAAVSALVKRDAKITKDNQKLQILNCKLITGLVLNQPNLDPHLLNLLVQLLSELPKCEGTTERRGR
jgi:hypothetical protein